MTLAAKSFRHLALAATASLAALTLAAPAMAGEAPANWGTFGIQTEMIDPAVKPGDDFNLHVNGEWMKRTQIPADKTRIGSFDELDELSRNRLRAIVEELAAKPQKAGSAEARIATAYKAFMDTGAIDAAGLAPARPWLDRIYAARTPDDLIALFGAPGIASPIYARVDNDPKQPDRYILNTGLTGLGLPDRDYYLSDDARFVEIRAKYKDYLAFLLGKAGYEDPAAAATAVLALETAMARAHWERALLRRPDVTYNKLTRADLAAMPNGALMVRLIDAMGAPGEDAILIDEIPPTAEELAKAAVPPAMAARIGSGLPGMLKLIAEQPVATWQAWLAARFLNGYASVLPREIDDAAFAFNGKVLSGQPEQRPRWKRGIATVEGQVGELLGKIYAERHFPPANKAAMDELVANLRKAMAANLKDLAWMGPETRVAARAKLDAFTPKIGYPDRFKTYDGLALSPDTPLANAVAAGDWAWKEDLAKLGKPIDRGEWHMLPQTVNAYYNPGFNEIVFPAAILQPPFFNLSADPAVNYGGIGAVIGHEIGHGFDDQGSNYDGTGMLRDWWTPEDKARFRELQDKLGAQYATYCPFDDGKTCNNPKLSMGENIGDLGGLSLAYRAYRMSLNGKEAPVIDGFTGDQRFFMGWAQVWRSLMREEAARRQIVTGPHSLAQFRVNGIVRNFDEWYAAFNVKPGDKLYLPPEQRVRIW